ncbi:ATP-binding protein [Novosphingobium terrae]|uniref:ATP-binding protein n=1 Tax=Novosphingobium terrae TaxID=2726189 RepID=UPI00197DF763|nr:winged helix-turn-helix domain-containing protein [Novosphingobium terrae]
MDQLSQTYRIGDFSLMLPQLRLWLGEAPVKLGGRALNLLAALAEARGDLVPRDALLARVWPNQAIDESAIRVHLSAARKALAQGGSQDNIIVNEAGRGYRLLLPVALIGEPGIKAPVAAPPEAVRYAVPGRLSSIVGREETIATIADKVIEQRFITLTGPGGIGKTTVAIAAAQHIFARRGLNAHFVDLAPVSDPQLVPGTVAAVLGLPAGGKDLPMQIAAHVSQQPALLILDNCEQVVDAAALLAEALFEEAPGLMLLATSREPLRAQGEWVHRLPALRVPAEDEAFDLAQLAQFPAITLFAQRALAANAAFTLTAQNAPAVIGICRTLDGIPLAIEFAAARSDQMAPDAILAGLEDRFALLSRGRRTALPRHRTLRGALDWSYALLDPMDQTILRRLAVFKSTFDLEAAAAVTRDLQLPPYRLADALADLVAKSLLNQTVDPVGGYRLLDTTRYYGIEQLDLAAEGTVTRGFHAEYLLKHLDDSARGWEGNALRPWLATYSRAIEDVRAALIWARSDATKLTLAIEIQIKSAVLWFHLSLAKDYLRHTEVALAGITQADVPTDLRAELFLGYGHALWHVAGPVPAMGEAFAQALTLAETNGSEGLILRARWGLWAHAILAGDYADSLTLARRFTQSLGDSDDLGNRQTALHMEALSLHFSGRQGEALERLLAVLAGDAAPERANHANHALVDGKIAALSLLARIRWQQGEIAEALALVREIAMDIDLVDHALSTCYGLAIGCIPIAMAAGDSMLAEVWIARLRSVTNRFDLDHWGRFALGYDAALKGTGALPAETSAMQSEMFRVAADPLADVIWHSAKA